MTSQTGTRGRTPLARFFPASALAGLAVSLAIFFWMNPSFFHRIARLHTWVGRGMLLLCFGMAWAALAACAMARRAWAAAFGLFFAVNLFVSVSYTKAIGRSMSLNDALNMKEAMGSFMDAVEQYRHAVVLTVLGLLLLAGALVWVRRQVRLRSNVPLFTCSLGVVVTYCLFLVRGGAGAMLFFPANFETGLHAAALEVEPYISQRLHRDDRPIQLQESPLIPAVRHVVLVIDESIEGEVFEDAMKQVRLPFAKDLGVAYSYGNNSACSNLLIRRAVDPDKLSQAVLEFPSLFETARAHGFATAYLDAQGILSDGDVEDYFTPKELALIDTIPPLKEYGPRYQRDFSAGKLLMDLLGRKERSFILINKQGTHFPYAKNLPPELAGAPDPYRTSLVRTSVGFLQSLAGHLPAGTVVFYTSDHGQNFHARAPHGNGPGECSATEWLVPLVVLYSPDLQPWASGIRGEWEHHGSHAVMAETVRNLLGRRDPDMRSLFDPPVPEDLSLHQGFCGSPRGLFGEPVLSIWIDEKNNALAAGGKGGGQTHS
jgi:hypothetical protein